MDGLTSRQRAVLDVIRGFLKREGVSPTLREIGRIMGLDLKSVAQHLDRLERKGYISRRPRESRNIRLRSLADLIDPTGGGLPLVGRIAAGQPVLAEENLEARVKIDDFFGPKGDVFLLRVQGESMKGAGISDGDMVAVRLEGEVRNSDIAAVVLDDEATVKRFFQKGDRIRLEPENEAFEPMVVDPRKKEIRVIGPVVGVIRKL
ncbi:MAG: transcriptional repressor LexA [Planctomycetota bacterium]|jgi:repressor LexA